MRSQVGKQLDEVVKSDLKGASFSKEQLDGAILAEVKKVPGMEELRVADEGLDFTDTVLASELSKSDQAAINKVCT